MKKLVSVLLATLFFGSVCFAQPQGEEFAPSKSGGPREQLAVTIFAGLGGAVLGLSTLSFYDRPQDHLVNIALGFAIGIIGGTIVSTYQLATRPYGTAEEHFGSQPWVTSEVRKDESLPTLQADLFTLQF